jgi:hypothetical protein
MAKLQSKVKARTDSHIRKYSIENYISLPKEGRAGPKKPNYSMVYEPNSDKILNFYNSTRVCGEAGLQSSK